MGQVPDETFAINNGQVGIMLESNIDGMILQENDFISIDNPTIDIFGIVVKNTGDFNNLIRKNRYKGNNISNLVNGVNAYLPNTEVPRGLVYLCNDNDNNDPSQQNDFVIASTSMPDKINEHQGEYDNDPVNPSYLAAGNLFSYNGHPNGDFLNEGGFPITYHYANLPRQIPMDFVGMFLSLSEPNTCVTEYCEPALGCLEVEKGQDRPQLMGMFLSHKESYNTLLGTNTIWNVSEEIGEQIGYHQYKMDRYAEDALMDLAADTLTYDWNEYIWWIGEINSYGSDLWLTKEYVAKDMWTEAYALMDLLPLKWALADQKLTDHGRLRDILQIVQAGRATGIFAPDIAALQSIAQYNHGFAPGWAKAILAGEGIHYDPVYSLPSGGGEYKRANVELPVQKRFTISPNPTTNQFTIRYDQSDKMVYHLNIYDVLGNRVFTKAQIQNGEILRTNALATGVYIIHIFDDHGFESLTKLSIQH